jgi:nitroreductase
MSLDAIRKLIQNATLAPSAFNLQNWHFTVVRNSDKKAKLKELSYGQQKVEDASVSVIVSGLLEPQKLIERALRPSLESEVLPQEVVDGWTGAVNNMYVDNLEFQRDEAIRSASLASMALMLAADEMGLASCPMIGFDPNGVKNEFNLPKAAVPTMIIPVGYPIDGNWSRKPRLPVEQVLDII